MSLSLHEIMEVEDIDDEDGQEPLSEEDELLVRKREFSEEFWSDVCWSDPRWNSSE